MHCAPSVHSRAESPGFSSSQIMTAPGQIGWMDVQIYGHGSDRYVTLMKFLGGNVTRDLRHMTHVHKSGDPSLSNDLVPSIYVMIKIYCNISVEWTPYLIRGRL